MSKKLPENLEFQTFRMSRLNAFRANIHIFIFAGYVLLMLVFISYHLYFANRIIPGVFVNGVNMGGLKTSEAIDLFNTSIADSGEISIKIGENYQTTVKPKYVNFQFLADDSIQKAFQVSRSGNIFNDAVVKIKGFIVRLDIPASYYYDKDALDNIAAGIVDNSVIKVKEPEFGLTDGVLFIIAGADGESFDESSLKEEIIKRFAGESRGSIEISPHIVHSYLSADDLGFVRDKVNEMISESYSISYDDMSWRLDNNEVLSMLSFQKKGDKVEISANKSVIFEKINQIALQLDRPARGQVLSVADGKVSKFTSSQNGLKVKIEDSARSLEEGILSLDFEIALAVEVTEPPETDNQYGIEEVIGVGESKFKGSDSERIHNLELAASRINGTLVPPGQEFSFNESVGEINRDTGYTSAWIISKGRTILGDGGGVCQVSTTVFRAAINSGLPIIKRNAHSYRVSYYEQESPPGMDATIYSPTVDLKFKNDTDHYILVASEIDKENYSLKFNIYGTSDGRKVEITEPKILSRSTPPAPVYEDDPTLPRGTTKQIEYAIWGASVSFDREVTMDGRIITKDTFKSNYRPWGAVYKVGTM